MPDLFNSNQNWLPFNGTVLYLGQVFNRYEIDFYTHQLLNTIHWLNDEANFFGKTIITKRKVAWYADKNFNYHYSNTTKIALAFTDDLLALKQKVESLSQEQYNSCLLNLYHNGNEGMAWHSDNETELKNHGTIASISFGATRKFSFKHKTTKQRVDVVLENGSLLLMKDEIQEHWQHRLPLIKSINMPRINLTFRTMNEQTL